MNKEITSWKNAGYAALCFAVAFAAVKWGVPQSNFFWLLAVVAGAAGIFFVAKSMPEGSDDATQDEWFNQNNGH